MQVECLNELMKSPEVFEKVVLAYWYSLPFDNPCGPQKVKVVRDNITFFNIELIKDDKMYGLANITKKELENYIVKLNKLDEHELDITNRIDKEGK